MIKVRMVVSGSDVPNSVLDPAHRKLRKPFTAGHAEERRVRGAAFLF